MIKTDIQKIHQLLKRAKENGPGTNVLINKALALLPCETCGGSGKVTSITGRTDPPWKPCPDCQP